MNNLHIAYAFIVAHWVGISTVLAYLGDNVANMLMAKHPTDAGYVRRIVNHIAITTTADFPKWQMKMPLSHGPVAKNEEAHPPVSAINPSLIFMMFCLSLGACATMKAAGTVAYTCAVDALPPEVLNVIGLVSDITNSGKSQGAIDSELDQLGLKYGGNVILCAVEKIVSMFSKTTAEMNGLALAQHDKAIQACRQYLLSHGKSSK